MTRGTLATFATSTELEAAVRLVLVAGRRDFDALTPFPVAAIYDLVPRERGARFPRLNVTGAIMLAAGVTGMLTGFGLQWIGNSWALLTNAGGKPFFSWPNYVPITFVLGILFAGVANFISYFWIVRLPEPYSPLFDVPAFRQDADLFHLYLPRAGDDAEAQLRARFPQARFSEVAP